MFFNNSCFCNVLGESDSESSSTRSGELSGTSLSDRLGAASGAVSGDTAVTVGSRGLSPASAVSLREGA